ncbi:redoxin domain-containing protein [Halobacteriovorax sp. GB3]|uniref:DUF6436 domain-containing protein n=1 Tax=Halobacteriovorax sp. GB3 TaxID=2719615 RepID=UPI00236198C2|nr:redoxin domain-containing protein [Halobacteriovorax sp. GB3]MDD0853586.1 redoxin domain-containing protein [Halobacteriovorax sp. GB3]
MKFFVFLHLLLLINTVSAREVLTFKAYSEKKQNLEVVSLVGKAHVIFFSSIDCPCSDSHMAHFNELKKKYPQVEFLAINVNDYNENKEQISAYYKEKSPSLNWYWDKGFKVSDLFKAVKTPHVFLLNEKGQIIYHGGVSNSSNFPKASKFYLQDALADLKANRDVKKKFARALGCYIAR